MKKLLLCTAFLLSAMGLFAQSKTTGVVNLTAGMTAKLDLNNTTATATLTLTGPSDRWFALQFGSFANGGGMGSGQDLVYYNGTTLVDAVHNGIGVTPSSDGTNNWTVTSNTVAGGTRTVVATRPFNTGSAEDHTFVYSNNDIDFAYAKSASASYGLAYHGAGNRGYALNRTFSCIPPSDPTASAQSFCAGATVADLAATGGTGATFKWYAAATGGSVLAGTTVLTNATYYVSQTIDACESARIAVAVTINTVAQPSANATQQFCSESTVADLTAIGTGTINWYNVANGGSPLAGTTVLTAGNYYVSQTVGSCESARFAVAVSYTTLATPTTDDTTPEYCGGSNVFDLSANTVPDGAIHWYADSTGGTELDGYTVLVNGTTYYAEQTLGNCVSNRLAITVTVNTIAPPATADDTQSFCAGMTLADLEFDSMNGATVNLRETIGGDILPATTVMTDGTVYNVSQVVDGCESVPLQITVTINAIPAAPGGNEEQDFTTGETIADLQISVLIGATIKWYMLDDEGDMVEVPMNTPLMDGEMYHVTQTINGCESEMLMVVVNEILGNSEFELKNLKAWPNPVSDVLTVSNAAPLSEIGVYNLLGQKLISQKADRESIVLNVSALPAGNYMVKVITAKGSSALLKIMKQ